MGARRAVEGYPLVDSGFAATREYKLLVALLNAMAQQDAEAFTAALAEFERVNHLDDWKVGLLLKAKQTIDEETLA